MFLICEIFFFFLYSIVKSVFFLLYLYYIFFSPPCIQYMCIRIIFIICNIVYCAFCLSVKSQFSYYNNKYLRNFLTKGKRANNIIMGTKAEQLNLIRNDITQFKTAKSLDQVIVLWTANTERFSEIITGVNDTADNLLKSIEEDHSEISPSTMFAVAAALEGV